jgi:hypothetical protein
VKQRQAINPRARIFVIGSVLLLPLLGLATWYWISKPSEHDGELARILRDYGYVALTPPSRFFGPGTITTVETLPDDTVQLHLTCRMNENSLAAMWRKSTTVNRRLATDIKQTFDSSGNVLGAIASRAIGRGVRGIKVSLQDINILTMSYEDLIGVRSQYLKGNCEEAIIWNLRAGASVCQPVEVLQADIVYTSGSELQLEGGGELKHAEQAAGGSVGISHHASETNDANGDDLFLGVKVRLTHCFRLAESGQRLTANGF